MPFTPQTVVYLLNVPLEEDQKNQLDFANVSAQTTYFLGKQLHAYTDFTYQRKDGVIRVPAEIDSIYNCNYVMYQNSNFTGKWFYAFITKMEYINANLTALTIKTDVFQTWQFNWQLLPSMIERNTTGSDDIGEFCEPEPLNVQTFPVDRVSLGQVSSPPFTAQNPILYFSKPPTHGGTPTIVGVTRVGFNSGALTMEYGKNYTSIYDNDLLTDLDALEAAGQLDLISDVGLGFYGDLTVTQDTTTTKTFIHSPITPKNRKTYNYCYGLIVGTSSFKLTVQQLKKHTFTYNADGYWGSSPFCVLNVQDVPNTVVEYRAFPAISVTQSTYENGLNHRIAELRNTQVSSTMLEAAKSGLSGSLTNLARGAFAGLTGNALSQLDLIAQRTNKDLEPDTLSGYSAPSAAFAANFGGIWLIRYAPTPEEFKRVDDFFSMFGYAINRIDTPNFKHRTTWDYIKTLNINITGDIPQDDVNELKTIFDGGLTVWHSAATFGDYSQLNPIVT